MIRFIISAGLLLIIPTSLFALSQEPWRNKTVIVPDNTACQSFPFDGGIIENSPVYLSVYSDRPVWIIIYNGDRFIRENVSARRRLVFNFITKSGFYIEVCRQEFLAIRRANLQQAMIKSGAKIPPEEVIPPIDPKTVEEFKLFLTSN